MEFITRNFPAYKTASSVTAQTVGRASCLGSWFGSAPVYKSVDGQRAVSPESSGFWARLRGSPSYKMAPAVSAVDDLEPGADFEPCPDAVLVL